MRATNVARGRDFLVDGVLRFLFAVPYSVRHNLEKGWALKQAFWHVAVDHIEGDYFEFGVASGNSLRVAAIANDSASMTKMGIQSPARRFYGFDTFDRFMSSDEADRHGTWNGSNFSFEYAEVRRRFRRRQDVLLFKGDVTELGAPGERADRINDQVGNSKAAVVLMDLDLGGPTLAALRWLAPRLQDGTVILFDEFCAFRGSPDKGEAGALQRFLSETEGISLRPLRSYGDGGRVLQVVMGEEKDSPSRILDW